MDVKRKKPFVSLASFSPKPPNQKDGEVRLSGSYQCTVCLFVYFFWQFWLLDFGLVWQVILFIGPKLVKSVNKTTSGRTSNKHIYEKAMGKLLFFNCQIFWHKNRAHKI